jgi:hypothetical protein
LRLNILSATARDFESDTTNTPSAHNMVIRYNFL